jgi:hypothetical protein
VYAAANVTSNARHPRLRRVLALAAAALAAAVLCAVASAASTPPSHGQAVAWARAINLTATDLAGYQSSAPDQQTAADRQGDDSLARCDGGVPTSQQVAVVNSRNFTQAIAGADREVNSAVTVLKSAALVQKQLHALGSSRGRTCLKATLNGIVRHSLSGVKVNRAEISALPVAATGTDGAVAIRITLALATHGVQFPAYFDSFWIARGPAAVQLLTLDLNATFPAADEHRLLAALTSRARSSIPG